MLASGFVLAGGRSSRMGQDKALLPYRGTTLIEHIAQVVYQALGNVTVIGNPNHYADLPHPVCPDIVPACGALGGVYTALEISQTEWNLIVACDMPGLSTAVLSALLIRTTTTAWDCVVAIGPTGETEPLCAAYHRRCLPALYRAIQEKRLKMKAIVAELGAEPVAVEAAAIANVNTPADWSAKNL